MDKGEQLKECGRMASESHSAVLLCLAKGKEAIRFAVETDGAKINRPTCAQIDEPFG